MTTEELVIRLEARIADFERELEQKFKPALAKAIRETLDSVTAEYLGPILDASTSLTEGGTE